MTGDLIVEILVDGIAVVHHPSMTEEAVKASAKEFMGHIRYRQKYPKLPGEEGYEFWQSYMDVRVDRLCAK